MSFNNLEDELFARLVLHYKRASLDELIIAHDNILCGPRLIIKTSKIFSITFCENLYDLWRGFKINLNTFNKRAKNTEITLSELLKHTRITHLKSHSGKKIISLDANNHDAACVFELNIDINLLPSTIKDIFDTLKLLTSTTNCISNYSTLFDMEHNIHIMELMGPQ